MLKFLNGPLLESDSYVGVGPVREVEDAIEINYIDTYTPEEAGSEDIDMDASPYNDRRRDGGGNRRGGRQSYGGAGRKRPRGELP